MNAIIVDDEKNCHDVLSALLNSHHPDIRVLKSCFNVADGVAAIQAERPDLVFLDVEMPDGTGFDLLHRVGEFNFLIIFITGHNNHAISAIRSGALDYLLKPVTADLLGDALDRARKRIAEKHLAEQIKHAIDSFRVLQQKKLPTRLIVSTLEGVHYIPIADIIRLEARANFTELFYAGARKRLLASVNIGAFEEQFDPYPEFMRVHRAHIVNLMMVETYVRGDANLMMKDGSEVAVSKENRDPLLKKLKEI